MMDVNIVKNCPFFIFITYQSYNCSLRHNSKVGVVMKNIYKRVEGPKTGSSTNVTDGHMTHIVDIQMVEGLQERVNNNQRDGWTRDTHIHIDTITICK